MKSSIVCFCLIYFLFCVQGYKIMLMFPFASSSHSILGTSLAEGLAEAGHDVTLVAPIEDKTPAGGKYRQVVLAEINQLHKSKKIDMFQQTSMWNSFTSFKDLMYAITVTFLNSNELRQMIKNSETFDAVIIEEFQLDALKVFPYLFKAHSIAFCPTASHSWVNDLVGNPTPLAYIPETTSGLPPRMSFFQRLTNVISYYLGQVIKNLLIFPTQRRLLKEYFPEAPELEKIKYNVSLLLVNSHVATSPAVPSVPNMIHIGGYHIQSPKPLPTDLQEFLDKSKEGVIYFSMGSVINTTDFPKEKRKVLLHAFKQLKQNVLWKWNEDIPEKSSNIKIEKWLPQQSILAHPNVKVFITHGGLLSATETIYYGKPVLAIPIFADQPANAQQMFNSEFGLIQRYDELENSQALLGKIQELLDNPKYYNNAQQRSKILHDQPMKPMEIANFWIEYIIRHKGAPHLRVVGAELPWYKLYLADVTVFILVLLYLIFKAVKSMYKKLLGRETKLKEDNKLKHH